MEKKRLDLLPLWLLKNIHLQVWKGQVSQREGYPVLKKE